MDSIRPSLPGFRIKASNWIRLVRTQIDGPFLPALILCFSSSIFGNTLILKDGRTIENVKTSLREDHVLVEYEKGNVDKFELTLVEKILVSEIKKSEAKIETPTAEPDKYKNIKKFYFSLNASQWRSNVSEEGIDFNRGYNAVDFVSTTIYIDPYLDRNYSVKVKSVSLTGEYRRNKNLGFTLGLEQNSFSFPSRGISPAEGIILNVSLNSLPEPQSLLSLAAGFSTISFLIDPPFRGYKSGKRGNDAFTIGTLSLLPGIKYYVPLTDSFFWFVQAGIGIGRSYDSGVYSSTLTQTTVFAGTGFQWESDSYFVNVAVQYRKTDLLGSVRSYDFQEPSANVGFGLKR